MVYEYFLHTRVSHVITCGFMHHGGINLHKLVGPAISPKSSVSTRRQSTQSPVSTRVHVQPRHPNT